MASRAFSDFHIGSYDTLGPNALRGLYIFWCLRTVAKGVTGVVQTKIKNGMVERSSKMLFSTTGGFECGKPSSRRLKVPDRPWEPQKQS